MIFFWPFLVKRPEILLQNLSVQSLTGYTSASLQHQDMDMDNNRSPVLSEFKKNRDPNTETLFILIYSVYSMSRQTGK